MASDPPDDWDNITQSVLKSLLETDFNARFKDQTPRGAALAAVGQLDEYIKDSLLMLLVSDESVSRQMFSEMGPLGSLGARIRMAYLLGIYNKDTYEDLIHISKIRNAFAHKHEVKDFSNPMVQGHCSSIGTMRRIAEDNMGGMSALASRMGLDVKHVGARFILACALLQAELKFWSHQILVRRGRPDILWPVLAEP